MFSKNSQIIKKYYETSPTWGCVKKKSMIKSCNIWKICLELNWFYYDPSTLDVATFWICMDTAFFSMSYNFLPIDTTDRSRNSTNQKRLFFARSLYPLSFLWTRLHMVAELKVQYCRNTFFDSFHTNEIF